MKSRHFVVPLVVLAIAVSIVIIILMQNRNMPAAIAVGNSRSIWLSVDWGGDIYQSERRDCNVWIANFNCELRRGGDLGVVISQTIPISATATVGQPGTGQWGSEVLLTWDISNLDIGPYETFVRLEVTDGQEMLYGYMEGHGHDGNMFVLVDRFQIGQICFVPLRFSVSQ